MINTKPNAITVM